MLFVIDEISEINIIKLIIAPVIKTVKIRTYASGIVTNVALITWNVTKKAVIAANEAKIYVVFNNGLFVLIILFLFLKFL